MPDYKELYLTMLTATEEAINRLIEAQQTCEELYIESIKEQKEQEGTIAVIKPK